MMYDYQKMRPTLFTEAGAEMLEAIRRNVNKALRLAGAVRATEAWRDVYGDSWKMQAGLDYLVERKEIVMVSTDDEVAQYRVYVAGPQAR